MLSKKGLNLLYEGEVGMEFKIERAKQLKEKPDETKLGFGRHFSDHMLVIDYTEGIGWH